MATGWNVSRRGEPSATEPLNDWIAFVPLATEEQQQQFRPNRQRLNRILANYLRRDEEPDDGYDPYDLDTRKRSVFRERDGELLGLKQIELFTAYNCGLSFS